jgi:hypothetical protein
MSNAAYVNESQVAETIKTRYISKTDAVFENHTYYGAISKLVKEGKIALHLIDGKIMLDADEAAREIAKFKTRSIIRQNLFA